MKWSDHAAREAARERFEQRMAVPVLIAAALLAAVSLAILFGNLSDGARRTFVVVDLLLWAFFLCEYLVRLVLSTQRRAFVKKEWMDLVLVVLPLLQPLRLLGALVRVARVSAAFERAAKTARQLNRHRLHLAFAWAGGLILIAAVITPVVEPDSGKIKSFGDGVWWAVVTTTTVGYGDFVPVSVVGRGIGFLLMLAGIGIIGLLTANIASLFLFTGPDPETADEEATADRDTGAPSDAEDRLVEINDKLDEVLRRLDRVEKAGAGAQGDGPTHSR